MALLGYHASTGHQSRPFRTRKAAPSLSRSAHRRPVNCHPIFMTLATWLSASDFATRMAVCATTFMRGVWLSTDFMFTSAPAVMGDVCMSLRDAWNESL